MGVVKQTNISFPCGSLSLEGVWQLPEGSGPFPAVVLCHPHPAYGGSMCNNVILALASTLVSKAIAAFSFNFRGVGRSGGRSGSGIDEQRDVVAAIDFVGSRREVDINNLGLAGYSFGAGVALPVAVKHERVKALALVSLPLGLADIDKLKSYPKPKLLICGSDDFIASSQEMELIAQELVPPKQFELIPGADHFWWGYEEEMAEKVSSFLASFLKRTNT